MGEQDRGTVKIACAIPTLPRQTRCRRLRPWTLHPDDIQAGLDLWGDQTVMAQVNGTPLITPDTVRAHLVADRAQSPMQLLDGS